MNNQNDAAANRTAKVYFIDTHVHFMPEHFDDYFGSFEENTLCGAWNIEPSYVRDGTEEYMPDLIKMARARSSGQIQIFYWPDWRRLTDPAFPKRLAKRIEEFHKLGIRGIKVWKDLGLGLQDPQGKLIMLDDRRLDPIWEKLIELKLILIAHVADPAVFWLPFDRTNPAYEELKNHPEWHFGKPGLPGREELFKARNALHKRFPQLPILNCHFGGYADDIAQLGRWMDEMPNFHASMGAHALKQVDDEALGAFLEKHSGRITFETDLAMRKGRKTDLPWNRDYCYNVLPQLRERLAGFGSAFLDKFARLNAENLIQTTEAR